MLLFAAGCATQVSPPQTAPDRVPPSPISGSAPLTAALPPAAPAVMPAPPPSSSPAPPQPATTPVPAQAQAARYEKALWSDIPDWTEPQTEAWPAWLNSCAVFRAQPKQAIWQRSCAAAAGIPSNDPVAQRRYFEANFTPYRLLGADGSATGLVTGYYEPLLMGSRKRTPRFRYPLHAPPADLVAVDLPDVLPDLRPDARPDQPDMKDRRVRGRVVRTPQGSKLVPYYPRADIVNGTAPVKGLEIAWVEDPVELFFLQVQGSGRIRLADGSTMRVGYADHNGHPYRSIGRWLIDAGEIPADQASMQGIKAWVKRYPERANDLLNLNPAYVFFREIPAAAAGRDNGPTGSLGVPLFAGRSIAVDARVVPLGAPVFLATSWPLSSRPLQRLVIAQDTGSAIRGPVRADLFWGFGADAGEQAGRMKQSGKMWMLWPAGESPPAG